VAAGVVVVGVLAGLLLCPLLAAVSAVDVLVNLEVVVFVFVEMGFGHLGYHTRYLSHTFNLTFELEVVQKYWICYLVTGIFKQFHGTDIGCVR
jgi:hypothetical protein